MANIFEITITGTPATSIYDLYNEAQQLKDKCSFVNLNMNGVILNVSCYESADKVYSTYLAILDEDKYGIVSNLPYNDNVDYIDIGYILGIINSQFDKSGEKLFTEEEIDNITNFYKKSSNKEKTR